MNIRHGRQKILATPLLTRNNENIINSSISNNIIIKLYVTQCLFYHVHEHGSSVTQEACIHEELRALRVSSMKQDKLQGKNRLSIHGQMHLPML